MNINQHVFSWWITVHNFYQMSKMDLIYDEEPRVQKRKKSCRVTFRELVVIQVYIQVYPFVYPTLSQPMHHFHELGK